MKLMYHTSFLLFPDECHIQTAFYPCKCIYSFLILNSVKTISHSQHTIPFYPLHIAHVVETELQVLLYHTWSRFQNCAESHMNWISHAVHTPLTYSSCAQCNKVWSWSLQPITRFFLLMAQLIPTASSQKFIQ
jgi:hypothetical protein